jgi:hypothetical protein
MDVLRRYLTIQFPYPDLLSQRRADSLARLGLIGLLLGASLIGLVLVLILQGADTDPTTLAMIPFAILGSFLAIFLANRGWLAAGSWVYVGLTLAAAFGLASVNGLFSESAMVLAAPLFVAGLLFDRRSIVALTVLEIVGVLVLAGSLAGSETAASDLLLRRVPPIAILVAFFGAAQWLLVNQFYASLSQVEAARQQLKAVTALARTLNRPGQEDRIIQAFCQSIQHDFDLYQVLLYLRDPDSPGTFHPRGASGMAAQRLVLEGHSVSLAADLPLTQAVKERSPIVARSTDLANMRAGFLPGTNIQLIQPVIYGDQIVGMLDLQSTDPLAFDEQMIETLGGLARQLGMALHNAVLSATRPDRAGAVQRPHGTQRGRNPAPAPPGGRYCVGTFLPRAAQGYPGLRPDARRRNSHPRRGHHPDDGRGAPDRAGGRDAHPRGPRARPAGNPARSGAGRNGIHPQAPGRRAGAPGRSGDDGGRAAFPGPGQRPSGGADPGAGFPRATDWPGVQPLADRAIDGSAAQRRRRGVQPGGGQHPDSHPASALRGADRDETHAAP